MVNYIILGIIQGLTEFLPVSSSAHLVIMQRILGLDSAGLVLSIVLHLGTACALVLFFFQDILAALRNKRTLWLVAVVTLVTGVIGVSGKDFFQDLFNSTTLVAFALSVTGIILISTQNFSHNQRSALTTRDAAVLGLTQGIAIIPGISRSGITISTLLFRKIDTQTAFTFSFLASLPAVFGAALLELPEINSALQAEYINLAVGFFVSLITGLIALRIVKALLSKAKLYYFGYYCIIIAVVTLLFMR